MSTDRATLGHPRLGRRVAVVGVLAGLVAAGGVASAVVKAPRTESVAPLAAAAVGAIPGGTSTVWSCPGPLPAGSAAEESSVELTNAGRARVAAAVRFVLTSGRSSTARLSVAPGAVVVERPPGAPAQMAAARVVADGRGLSVVELVHGGSGPIAAPCAPAAETTAYLLAGDTRRSDQVDVALFDPGATPSVASLSFATASGPTAPPAFQGVPVPAGGLVVLSVADRLPFEQELGITVHAVGGNLAVGALDTTRVGSESVSALEAGATAPSTRWFFPAGPSGPDASQTIDLLNPSSRRASVELGFLSATPGAKVALSVPPGGIARVVLPSATTLRALGAPVVTATNGVPIVAGRELRVGGVITPASLPEQNPILRARRALLLVPRIPPAYTITGGVAAPRRVWVLGGGEQSATASEFVSVTNPTRAEATVSISPVGGGTWVRALGVGPMSSQIVDLADLPQVTGRFAVIVSSTVPVVASGALYARGLVGFTSAAALPAD